MSNMEDVEQLKAVRQRSYEYKRYMRDGSVRTMTGVVRSRNPTQPGYQRRPSSRE